MLLTAVIAALAAIPAVAAQDVTATAIRCTTRFGFMPLPSGTAAVPTWYLPTTTTNIVHVTVTSRDTVVVTPTATVLTDVLTTTLTVSTTSTSTPLATTVPTPAGFVNLLVANLANPTPVPRFKRHELEYRAADVGLPMLKRQTAPNNVGGYAVGRDGNSTNIYRRYPYRVDCRVLYTVNTTETTVVTGLPETAFADGATATALSTSTIFTTSTVTEVMPRETVYAACQPENVVNRIEGFTGNELVFDRVIYRPAEGFPIANELIVNTTSATNCCIACQNTPFCAGSFYVPKPKECHLRLTQAPAVPAGLPGSSTPPTIQPPYAFNNGSIPVYGTGNSTAYPTAYATGTAYASGALATGIAPTSVASGVMPPFPTSTATPNTCPAGSMSMYLGTIQGQEDFPIEYALSFSNGPCGRLSVWPIPVDTDMDTTLEDRRLALH